jgi:hypothetical protein
VPGRGLERFVGGILTHDIRAMKNSLMWAGNRLLLIPLGPRQTMMQRQGDPTNARCGRAGPLERR